VTVAHNAHSSSVLAGLPDDLLYFCGGRRLIVAGHRTRQISSVVAPVIVCLVGDAHADLRGIRIGAMLHSVLDADAGTAAVAGPPSGLGSHHVRQLALNGRMLAPALAICFPGCVLSRRRILRRVVIDHDLTPGGFRQASQAVGVQGTAISRFRPCGSRHSRSISPRDPAVSSDKVCTSLPWTVSSWRIKALVSAASSPEVPVKQEVSGRAWPSLRPSD
jgi:hypothetical protein